MEVEFILYVTDQQRSARFYTTLLGQAPNLDVPGMTEFHLGSCKLGLMPEHGIAHIITPVLPHPSTAQGAPRCELYLLVDDFTAAMERAHAAGAIPVSPASDRDWGHHAAYFADPDGHVVAMAQPIAA